MTSDTATPLRSEPASQAPDWRTLELLLLSQVVQAISHSQPAARVLREMLHLMSEWLGLNRGRIVLAEESGTASRIAHAYGLTRDEMARGRYGPGEGVTGRVLASGQLAIVQDVDAEPGFLFRAVRRKTLPSETVAFLAVPIQVERRTVGVLACHRLRGRRRPLGDDVALLKLLATLAAQVLQVQKLAEGALAPHRTATAATAAAAAERQPTRDYFPATSHPAQDLTEALRRNHGNRSRAAQSLGLTPRQFGYRLRKLGLQA